MRMIFINLPVSDLNATKRFFGALGFSFNPEFSDDSCAAMIVEENIYAMLQLQARFKEFITQPVSDAFQTTETITCLSASSRAEVDTLAKALAAAPDLGSRSSISASCMAAASRIRMDTSGSSSTSDSTPSGLQPRGGAPFLRIGAPLQVFVFPQSGRKPCRFPGIALDLA